jgi:hypothetical protein
MSDITTTPESPEAPVLATPHRAWYRRPIALVTAGAPAVGALAAALALTGTLAGSSAPALIQVHGTLAAGLGSSCQINGGDQVTITDPSGKVLAAPSLPLTPVAKKYTTLGVTVTELAYPFIATVPPETRYGITAEGNQPYYVTQAQFEKGIDLSC